MFAAEFEPADPDGRRRSARAPVSVDAAWDRGGLGRALCKVVDVSLHGVKLQTYTALKRGSVIWLTLPGIGTHVADVMWADDFRAGCQFHHPLTDDQRDALLEHDARG